MPKLSIFRRRNKTAFAVSLQQEGGNSTSRKIGNSLYYTVHVNVVA